MSSSQESVKEKVELEHIAAKIFMRHYEKLAGKPLRHIWHNEPKKPDVSCKLDGERLDIEIAHLYGSEEEAMFILGRELTEVTRQALIELQKVSVDVRLLNALNRILLQKSGKYYESDRVWLVIRNAHPAWSRRDIEALQHHITIPESHPFAQIWIVGDMEGISGIVKLYP